MTDRVRGRVLVIAGSDSGGGAGVQADIKTITAFSGYAATAITALTAQNTLGVHGVHPVPEAFIRRQIRVVLDDIGADALKTGMLATSGVIKAVAGEIAPASKTIPLVLDPVMTAKGGARLLETSAVKTLRDTLIPLAYLTTPNLPEAEILCGFPVRTLDAQKKAGEAILQMGAQAVLVKGGHGAGDTLNDVLVQASGARVFTHPRLKTRHTHGTGCTLASAIATGLARGALLEEASAAALDYVHAAIASAPGFGQGNGPLNHHA